ncbi:energy-coupling factor transport system permease protein [Asanoa ferruginea]|uniref:Energy-coupling factor transport system permease protein n=1 Tax=Asanoa ferruginea TaxID=53367 RepID=A0A3D9ZEI1_9ACTN|nr:energy-coupling factor transporter transmembrane component T [Asanoa ferruginea]REF94253.1 energy-coupling factor transport system permease protein [Asanoa ferruginea]GIF49798.1 ABC transporter [Asanoa ferruginea]
MTLTAVMVRSSAPLARRNPVAKLVAATVFAVGILTTLDPLTPALAIAAELVLLPFFGVRYGTLLRRGWPLLLSVFGIVLTTILFGANRGGDTVFSIGPLDVTTGVLTVALGLALRLVALALPGIMVFTTTDPTDLADALVQNAKAPARFAIGTLAAFRLIPLLGQEWQALRMARRARGIDAGHNPVVFAALVFALLVGAIRRGTRLALAMDARGFDSSIPRTHARAQHFTRADTLFVAGSVLLTVAILTVSITTDTFRPVLG